MPRKLENALSRLVYCLLIGNRTGGDQQGEFSAYKAICRFQPCPIQVNEPPLFCTDSVDEVIKIFSLDFLSLTYADEVVQEAPESMANLLGRPITVVPLPGGISSASHSVLVVWVAPRLRIEPSELRSIEELCHELLNLIANWELR